MNKMCSTCGSTEKYYAKQLCSPCYQKAFRRNNPEKSKQYDFKRNRTEKRRAYERARSIRRKVSGENTKRCREYRANTLLSRREYDRKRYQNPNRKQYVKELKLKNIERTREIDRQEYHRNKAKHIARVMERYALMRGQACPKWLSNEQKKQMADFYKNRPEGHHVDHIVPLRGRNVSGLHVPWNLQYLPAKENLSKGNRGY